MWVIGNFIGIINLDDPSSFEQDDIYILFIKHIVNKPHLQCILVTQIIEVLITWEAVANDVLGLPPS